MPKLKISAAARRFWSKGKKGLLGMLAAVVVGVLIAVLGPITSRVITDAGAKKPSPVNVKVADNSVCNFVAPLSGALIKDPTKLKIRPDEVQNMSCDKALAKINGARADVALEAVLAPSGDAAIVLTDVTIHVIKSYSLGRSAYYSPGGSGGGGGTLDIEADVEKKTAVQSVDTYIDDETTRSFDSVLAVRPRPTATRADPLVVDIDLHGDRNYTKFDVELHWQSSTDSGVLRLDNGGRGYLVAGSGSLPSFRDADGDKWESGRQ